MTMVLKVLAAVALLIVMPFSAMACEQSGLTTRCDQVTDHSYEGGGRQVEVVPIRVCLSDHLLQDGSAAWVAGFYYGGAQPERVVTVRQRCWTHGAGGTRQHGAIGAMAVAFICCDLYCGWVGGRIAANGQVAMQPIALPRGHDPQARYRLGDVPGAYDSARILR